MKDIRQLIIFGNIMLAVCCLFYLAWWLLAFHPVHPVKGMKSGWLLVMAVICGLTGLFLTGKAIALTGGAGGIAAAGVIAYTVLAFLSVTVLKRPLTSELFLIVLWTALLLAQADALAAALLIEKKTATVLTVMTVTAGIISLACYVVYYRLDVARSYYDGMIPLLLSLAMSAAVILAAF